MQIDSDWFYSLCFGVGKRNKVFFPSLSFFLVGSEWNNTGRSAYRGRRRPRGEELERGAIFWLISFDGVCFRTSLYVSC